MATNGNAQASIARTEALNVERATGIIIPIDPAKRTKLEARLATTWGDGSREEWEVGCGRCKVCAIPYESIPTTINMLGENHVFPDNLCPDCCKLVEAHYVHQIDGAGTSESPKWDEHCPPRFKQAIANPSQLPDSFDLAAFRRVIGWRPTDHKGLALIGPSGAGKTVSFWALARALEESGTPPVILTAIELGRILSTAARDIKEVPWLCNCRVLMVDDLGKEKASPAVGALLWEVLNHRYSHGLPLIVTSRFAGDDFADRFGERFLGDDIRRRMNEVCAAVRFTLQSPSMDADT